MGPHLTLASPHGRAYASHVTGDGSQQHGRGSPSWGSGPEADDVIEQGGGRRFPALRWRPSRGAAILLAVGLVAGLAAGYAAGDRQWARRAAPPRSVPASGVPVPASGVPVPASGVPALSLAGSGPALTQDIGTCAVQNGHDLQLGVQVTNQSAADVTLSLVRPVLPLGGLKWVSQQWAPCSALPTGQDPAVLTPGASTWFSVTFQVLVRCPGPLPVQFTIRYVQGGQPAVTTLPGFNDLSGVPYSGCPGPGG